MRLKDIADKLGARLDPPDQDLEILGVAPIESAASGQISFIANPKYAPLAKTTAASALIVDDKFPAQAKPLLRTKNPQFAYARAVELFYHPPRYAPGIHPAAVVDPSARIGAGASIGAY